MGSRADLKYNSYGELVRVETFEDLMSMEKTFYPLSEEVIDRISSEDFKLYSWQKDFLCRVNVLSTNNMWDNGRCSGRTTVFIIGMLCNFITPLSKGLMDSYALIDCLESGVKYSSQYNKWFLCEVSKWRDYLKSQKVYYRSIL